MFRRGNVWHWRRRAPSQSTEIACLQLSLGTTSLADACIIARRLSYESDRMFDDIIKGSVSAQDARSWLKHVLGQELSRVRQAQVETILLSTGDEGICQNYDYAKARAWKMMAQHGIATEITPVREQSLRAQGLSQSDVTMTRLALTLNARTVEQELDTGAIAREFQRLVGSDALPAGFALLELVKILVEGRAAAWANLDNDNGIETALEMARELADECLKTMNKGTAQVLLPEAKDVGHMTSTDPMPAPIAQKAIDIAAAIPTGIPADSLDEANFQPNTASTAEDAQIFDPALMAVALRLSDFKQADDVSESCRKQYLSCAKLFIRITGLTDIRIVKQGHVATFRNTLLKLPKHWGRSPKNATRLIADILQDAKSMPTDQVGLSLGTINRHLEHIAQFFAQAKSEGIAVNNDLDFTRLRRKEEKRDRDKRASFHKTELENLFHHTIWKGCKSPKRRNDAGTLVLKDGLYWAPIIAAYTGARREEIAALTSTDIGEEDGIAFIRFVDNENRALKNFASERRVPLHYRLIELGFLQHVERSRKLKVDLFPELRPSTHRRGSSTKYGKRFYYAWRKALELRLDGNPRKLCFHSTRHYVIDCLKRQPDISKQLRFDVLGHEGDDIQSESYGEVMPLHMLKAAIDSLPVVI